MINDFINEYPYSNLTYANIDWLIKKVKELSGDEEDTNTGIRSFLSTYANQYPYTNLTYANIDWLIKNVAGFDDDLNKLEAEVETLSADVKNCVEAVGSKLSKLEDKNVIYATDNSTPAKTIGIVYTESPVEGTIPRRSNTGMLKSSYPVDEDDVATKQSVSDGLSKKLNRVNKESDYLSVYAVNKDGGDGFLKQKSDKAQAWSVPLRFRQGQILAARSDIETDSEKLKDSDGNPVDTDNFVVTQGQLKEVDTKINNMVQKTNSTCILYGTTGKDDEGNTRQSELSFRTTVSNNSIAQRTGTGQLKAATPVEKEDLTTKKYVDDAVKTSSAGGWVRVIDKVWIEDEPTGSFIKLNVPDEYQKRAQECRIRYYMNTPDEGAVYSSAMQLASADTKNNQISIAYVPPGKLIDTDKKALDVNWTSNGYKDSDSLRMFTLSNAGYDKGVPTPNVQAPLQQSTITVGDNTYTLDSFLENRTHTVTGGTTTKTYTGTLVEDLQIEPPTTKNVAAYDYGIIEQELTVDNIKDRVSLKNGAYTIKNATLNEYDDTYTSITGELSPNGYYVYYLKGDTSGIWQKGRFYTSEYSDSAVDKSPLSVVTDTTITYTTNDYYSSAASSNLLSQVISSTDNTYVGRLVDFNKSISACTFKWSGETPISYKQVWTVHGDIIDESIQGTYSGLTPKNSITSFDSRIGVETISGTSAITYYSGNFADGIITSVTIIVPTSTSKGVTGKKVYAGSRLIAELRY